MGLLTAALPLALLASATTASPTPTPPTSDLHQRTKDVQWGPCHFKTANTTELPIQCAKLPVPLDYSDKDSTETIDLDLIKVAAEKQPSKGSILFNFGGPGGDGLNNFVAEIPKMGPQTGGEYDLVSWDPRGTGNTLTFNCFPNDTEIATATTLLRNERINSYDGAEGRAWAEYSYLAETCGTNLKDIGDKIGMSFVARDIMQIVDALEDDGLLRYWGISGGTTMGATVAAMFPDRMDKVLLDGVMNAHQYWNAHETESITSADDVFEGFFDDCAKNPLLCPFARNRSSEELAAATEKIFADLKQNPLLVVAEEARVADIVSYNSATNLIFSRLYNPAQWIDAAQMLAEFEERRAPTYKAIIAAAAGSLSSPVLPEYALVAIRSGDKIAPETTLEELRPVIDEWATKSKWFGDQFISTWEFAPALWQFKAKERYEGDYQVKTKNPVLFIGNTYDPVTPLVSAHNMSSGFEGSVVLQHNGYGHLSTGQPSNCTNQAISDFFSNGDLPEAGTICEPNMSPFKYAAATLAAAAAAAAADGGSE